MPPSPAMRCSPGREPRADNHKRGRSFESGMPSKQRDDDLALFNEVQSRERDNFLLQADDDDFEHIFPNRLRYFSDYKLGINIPARGESSDLLHAEEEKNDYEWLLTPPDTPLFASLDDEAPQVNVAQRGRAQTQPISISRSSTMEKSRRSSRGSASPNRLSPSPRSHNSPFEGRAQSSSAPTASPPTSLRPTPASIRSPPPSRKPVPRASTSAPRRLSTGSNGTTNTRGISPVKTNRGNSASPKIRAWQSNIPGFSTEIPPNLRTSLADRPASYVRGSSPASRNSRQSMSPTASRSISSSHSHERDRFSSHSKGSVGSSAEDDMESLSSVLVGSAQRPNARRVGGFQNNHNKASPSKKASRPIASSSAPKRSFDLALRHMDQKKGPQNMFRQLLSSVPSSTFHAGVTTSAYHPMISRNSSVTTSSNASSGLGISGAHDPEASQDDDATSERVDVRDCDVDDEVFVIEKDEGVGNESRGNHGTTQEISGIVILQLRSFSMIYRILIVKRVYCVELYSPLTGIDPVASMAISGSEMEVNTIVEPQMGLVKARSGQHDDLALVKDGQQSTYGEPIWNFLSESSLSLSRSRSEDCESKVDFSNPKVGSSEGAGISILLKRSSSIKGAVVRNTNFSASSISYDDLSYVRDSIANSMRSVSASSSVDLGPVRFQRQSSSTKSETGNYKFDGNGKHQRSGSSLSGTSSHAFHPSSLGTSTLDSLARDVQESNVENDTCFENVDNSDFHAGPEQTRVDSGEPLIFPASKSAVSISSVSSIEELQEDVAVSGEDYDTSNHANGIIDESIVLVGCEGGTKGRSLTLEEATDTILFCSSIVHNLALNAAAIAIEKENPSGDDGSWPLIPAIPKTDLDKPERNPTKRQSKSQKSRQKKEAETDTAEAPNATETEGKTEQPKTRIVGVRDSSNGESKKPPLLESKCNCTIM
ncbi:hypothetical protein OSB04_009049 [Centaurea solstitialis]|uniref:Uncharacterized protein n=1 Tax=Centaurea solstitialis TaxID=347529 RepID=A0AA38TPQ5_9ASTR|nr:hypothetical protein OSB04_009049 [Centaurea solstitialis]